jgi:hypothetical protein
MAEISNQRIYDLLLEISNGADKIEASIDDLLVEVKAFNQELSSDKQLLMHQVYSP